MELWDQIGRVPPRDLVDVRLGVHHAVQLVSIAVGRALVPHRDDDSHTTLAWQAAAAQWIGEPVPGTDGLRAGLRPADLTLTVGTVDAPATETLALAGRTRDDGLAWLRQVLAGHGVDPAKVVLDFHYDMPSHPVEEGATWSTDQADVQAELARWYAAAAHTLVDAVDGVSSSPVLTWPHHFDVGALLAHGDDDRRSIGIGLSPGDGYYPEPYFYVSPYPRPAEDVAWPALPAGHWHDEPHFFGAVLTATELVASGSRSEMAAGFLTGAIAAARRLLDHRS